MAGLSFLGTSPRGNKGRGLLDPVFRVRVQHFQWPRTLGSCGTRGPTPTSCPRQAAGPLFSALAWGPPRATRDRGHTTAKLQESWGRMGDANASPYLPPCSGPRPLRSNGQAPAALAPRLRPPCRAGPPWSPQGRGTRIEPQLLRRQAIRLAASKPGHASGPCVLAWLPGREEQREGQPWRTTCAAGSGDSRHCWQCVDGCMGQPTRPRYGLPEA